MNPSVADADAAHTSGTLLSVDCTFSSGEGSLVTRLDFVPQLESRRLASLSSIGATTDDSQQRLNLRRE
jgi:hypothetical protein